MTGPAADQDWTRLHPLTPLLRGARFGLLLVVLVGQQGVQGLQSRDPFLGVGAFVVGVVLAAALAWVSWRVTRYRVADGELQVDSGVLQRRSRRVPLARLQSVDVVRPLFARVLGLAELRLEVAGGGDTEAPLQYLSEDDAQRLRTRLLDLAAGRAPEDARTAPPAPEQVLVAVPTGPLVASVLLGGPLVVGGLLLVAAVVVSAVDLRAAGSLLVGSLPLLLAVGAAAVRRLLTEYGFRVSESADGLRLRHGLLETRSATIPLDRVQVVRTRRPLLWRPWGWVRVEVDVAGYAGGEDRATSALLPVAPAGLADALVARVLGGPPPEPRHPVPSRARLRAPVQAPRLGVGLDDRHLVSRYGVLVRTTDVVPLGKVQSLRLLAGPWQRRLGLASLAADTAGRRLAGTTARHRDAGEAAGLLEELAVRTRQARAGARR